MTELHVEAEKVFNNITDKHIHPKFISIRNLYTAGWHKTELRKMPTRSMAQLLEKKGDQVLGEKKTISGSDYDVYWMDLKTKH